jgi:hypothetical protein
MTHVTPDYVKAMQLKHKAAFWKISDKTKKTVINRNQNDNLNYSIDELQEALNISGDYVIVTLYTSEPKEVKQGDQRTQSFELMVKLNDNYQYNNKGMNGAPIDLLLKMNDEKHAANLEFEKLKNLRESTPQKHWIAEMAQNNPELVTGVISLSKMAATKLFDFMTPTKINNAVSGPDTINPEIKEVLKKFEAIDPDYLEVLKRMATFVGGDQETYLAFKRKLLFDV